MSITEIGSVRDIFNPHNLFLERLGEGKKYRQIHFLKQTNVLGRALQCDVVLIIYSAKLHIVSRRHCQIEFRNSKMYISNIKNLNGTFVNGSKITQETELREGDKIGIGCKPTNLNNYQKDFLMFTVKKEIIEMVELNSSDEMPNDDEIDDMCNNIDSLSEMEIEKIALTLPELSSDEELEQEKAENAEKGALGSSSSGTRDGQQVKPEKELKRRASGDGEEISRRIKVLKLSEVRPSSGFNPIEALDLPSFFYQTNGTKLRSILKKSSNTSKRPRRNIQFDEDESGHIVKHFGYSG